MCWTEAATRTRPPGAVPGSAATNHLDGKRPCERGSPRVTFVVGALLTLPGGSYLAGLSRIDKLNYSTAETVVLVVAFNLIMLSLLEIPLLGFAIAQDWTVATIERTKVSLSRNGRRFAVTMLTVLGTLLVVKALIEFLG